MSLQIALGEGQHPRFASGYQQRRETQSRVHEAAMAHWAATLPGKMSDAEREATVARLRKMASTFNKKLQYEVNHESHEITVKVIDGNTDKVIKVLPPEELQRLQRGIDEAVAVLLDERA